MHDTSRAADYMTIDAHDRAVANMRANYQAALDAVLKEAETFASKLLTMYRFAGLDEERSELMQEVKAFLDSPAVRGYRARQEKP